MRNKLLQYSVLLIIEIILLGCIIYFGVRIFRLIKGKVKGVQYISRLEKKDFNFKPSGNLQYFYELKPNSVVTQKLEWIGKEAEQTINSDSLNDRFNYEVSKAKNIYRILALGDSFTYGIFVSTNDNYTEFLENFLNNNLQCPEISKFEVLNLGVSNYDTEYVIRRFQNRGLKYKPDLVLWLLNYWDMTKLNEKLLPIEYKLEKEGIPWVNPKDGTMILALKANKEFYRLYNINEIFEYQKSAMEKIPEFYTEKLHIFSFNKTYESADETEKMHKFLQDFIGLNSNYSYSFISNKYWFDDTLHFPDTHPNVKGHQELAEELFQQLKENYFSSCKIKGN